MCYNSIMDNKDKDIELFVDAYNGSLNIFLHSIFSSDMPQLLPDITFTITSSNDINISKNNVMLYLDNGYILSLTLHKEHVTLKDIQNAVILGLLLASYFRLYIEKGPQAYFSRE